MSILPAGFTPLNPPQVKLYTCGPTVYNFAHIGNFRTYVFEDLLRRYLEFKGYQVTHVMNITDVEDKIIRNALAQRKSLADYTAVFTQAFVDAMRPSMALAIAVVLVAALGVLGVRARASKAEPQPMAQAYQEAAPVA